MILVFCHTIFGIAPHDPGILPHDFRHAAALRKNNRKTDAESPCRLKHMDAASCKCKCSVRSPAGSVICLEEIMKNLFKRLTSVFVPAVLSTALLFTTSVSAASIRPSTESITLEKGVNTASFDVILTADEPFAGAEFGLKPSSDDVTFQSLTFLDAEGEPTVRTIKDGVLYFGFFSGSNKYEAKTYQVARLTYQYTGTSQRTISLVSSKIVTIDGTTNTTVGDTSSSPFTVTLTRAGNSTSGGGSSGGSGGSGSSDTSVQKPDIIVGEGGSISQSEDGSSVTIKPDNGYTIDKVTLNGVSVGQTDNLDGLKTGDKVVISFAEIPVDIAFEDIQNHWAKSYIETAVGSGLFTGISGTAFGPDISTSRAMLVTVLYRLEGSPSVAQPAGFTDLHADWYRDSVAWGAANGIVNGYD